MYDIFYVSKGDIIEKDWKTVKNKYPTAQCISHVSSFEQIKSRAFTKMFWVIWDDLELKDSFDLSTYQATKWDDRYVHVFLNGNHYDGICLFPKNAKISQREFEHRFFINKKEINIVASTPKPYDIFYINTYVEYLEAIKSSTTEMFWVVWENVKVNENFRFEYAVPYYNNNIAHVFKNGNYYDGICLFSKNLKVTKKEFEYRFFMNKKEVGVQASMPKPYDIVFISYKEPNAEKNYQNLKEKFPNAKRIDGVKGIHKAHQAAAALSSTEMFWAVDGDAVLTSNFVFDFVSPYYEKDSVYVWRSQNPINNLVYGYGGVKLLPKKLTLEMKLDSPDMTTTISKKFKAIDEISNITEFNTDPFNTWKSAFRECVKLASKVIRGQLDAETEERLKIWTTVGGDKPFGEFAIAGAKLGKEYGEKYKDDPAALSKINDFDWLEREFKTQYQEYTCKKYNSRLTEFKEKLNSISSSFCAAKWKQVTIHLATGQTHSCHHPESHHIPIQEIKIDPSALHNTEFKKSQRKLMLEGVRPKECGYCWKVEDNGKISDRVKKSMDYWAIDHIGEISKMNHSKSINPSYLEVSFSNVCNFKCSYCSPDISSQWLDEINRHGSYPTSTNFNDLETLRSNNRYPFLENSVNPYVDAFWKWWPELYPDLKVLRVTGGEPLLTKNTYKLLDYILENPRPDLELNINSNLCVPEKIFLKFIETISKIREANAIRSFKIFTSCEAKGRQAEYIRYGLDYNRWLDNCDRILSKTPNSKLTIISTYNALSVSSFKEFLDDVFLLKSRYVDEMGSSYVGIDIPYLRYPFHQAVNILTESFLPYFEDQIIYMNEYSQRSLYPKPGFRDHEINKLEIAKMILETQLTSLESIRQHRKDFTLFVDEHDRRRGTDFLNTFPEYEEFYKMSKELKL